MKVLVSDTLVLIDLDRGSLVEPTFRLPFEFTVPDLLYERELKDHGGPEFIRLGLRVAELGGDEVALALSYLRKRRSLSLPDSFALALAKTNSWMLLSGDRGMRELAVDRGSLMPRCAMAARSDVRASGDRPARPVRRPSANCRASAMQIAAAGNP